MTCTTALNHNLGTFEGFNFRTQSAIERTLSVQEVIGWNHAAKGEAEFWPSGDHSGVCLVFRGSGTTPASDLIELDRLLTKLVDDSAQAYVRIRHTLDLTRATLAELSSKRIADLAELLYEADDFAAARRQATYEVFKMFYPELYELWKSTPYHGINFKAQRFLDSPSRRVKEYSLDSRCFVVVTPV